MTAPISRDYERRNPSRTIRFRLAGWFLLGSLVASVFLWLQVDGAGGDLAAILRVGESSAARAFIESELGPIPVTQGSGHDGQYSYLIARDPFGLQGLPYLADDGQYRFRRALHGWLAGGFGLLPPRIALIALAAWSVAAVGVATAATAYIARRLGTRRWATLGVLANIGLILSVQLGTVDTLAFALALIAVALVLREHTGWAVAALAAAALAKDSYLLFSIGLAGWAFFGGRRRLGFRLLLVPGVTLGAWTLWLGLREGGALSSNSSVGAPLTGLMSAIEQWDTFGDLILAIVGVVSVVGGVLAALVSRDKLLRWLAFPWLAIAIVSTDVVWRDGNNAARVFAPMWFLTWLGVALLISNHGKPDSTSQPSVA